MDNRTLYGLIIAAVIAVGLLFAIRLAPLFEEIEPPAKYLSAEQVQEINVVHLGRNYPLTEPQKETFLNYVNRFVPVIKGDFTPQENDPFGFAAVIIYLVGGGQVELRPITRVRGDNIIFDAPALDGKSYLRDLSEGALEKLLEKSYEGKESKVVSFY